MSAPNGKPNGSAAGDESRLPAPLVPSAHSQAGYTPEEIKSFISRLEIPFEASLINWRVTNTSKNGKLRGMVLPYADQRAYTDRLNELFTPAGWTRHYNVHTSANFDREKDQKTVAKVFVTCELTLFGIGSHSATGEEWADDPNAGTSAEAQSFKRSAACFGLGRYLYYFEGVWVDLDERKRPKSVPKLPEWATPAGWVRGSRPNAPEAGTSESRNSDSRQSESDAGVLAGIEALAHPLGRGLYRGILRDLARVWNPREIHDVSIRQRVLGHLQAAERGLRRLEAALDKTGPEALIPVLKSLGLASLERVDTLELLKRIVLDVEQMAGSDNS